MFWTKDPEPTKHFQNLLERELELAIAKLKGHEPNTKEYTTVLANIERLHEMVTKEQPKSSSSVSKDTLVSAGANLVAVAMIIRHEHLNIIASKAMGFVGRPR